MSEEGTPTVGEGTGTSTSDAGTAESVTKAQLESIIGKKTAQHARALEKAREQAANDAVELLAERLGVGVDELDDVAEQLKSTKSDDSEAKKLARQLKKLTAERDEIVSTFGKLKGEITAAKVKDAVFSAASKVGAFEEEVFALLKAGNRVGVDDDGSVIVRDADGDVSSLSVDKLVSQLVSERKHLQRATPNQGAGSVAASPNGIGKPDPASREAQIAALSKMFPNGMFGKSG